MPSSRRTGDLLPNGSKTQRGNQSGNRGRLADEATILGVLPDPEPQDPALHINPEGAMTKASSARPKAAHALEMKRGVLRVSLEKLIFFLGQAPDCGAQSSVTGPKLWRGKVPQNSGRFALRMVPQGFIAERVEFAGFRISLTWLFDLASSNSANHRRNSASSSAERAETRFSKAWSLLMRAKIPPSFFAGERPFA